MSFSLLLALHSLSAARYSSLALAPVVHRSSFGVFLWLCLMAAGVSLRGGMKGQSPGEGEAELCTPPSSSSSWCLSSNPVGREIQDSQQPYEIARDYRHSIQRPQTAGVAVRRGLFEAHGAPSLSFTEALYGNKCCQQPLSSALLEVFCRLVRDCCLCTT
ncbi:hypothetical protein O3P69_015442 [Scylla paramamosain]|uniref:Uncharacterized protein n=1 Tax=Scylla paramamosain TaxID=85552 RepID=A0AAW0T4M3_SCYPA